MDMPETTARAPCGANGAASCNDGQCVSDDLANWFDLSTPAYQKDKDPENGRTGSWRCACNPQDIDIEERDTYEEAFYMIAKYGAGLETTTEDLPPRPEYFGLQCTANCPRVADKACDGRGFCKSTPTGLSEEFCTVDNDCSRISDSVEDDDRYCYLENDHAFGSTFQSFRLPRCRPAQATRLNGSTVSLIRTTGTVFATTTCHRPCSPQTHSGYCRDCAKLVESPALWQDVNEKCSTLVEYSNLKRFKNLQRTALPSAQCPWLPLTGIHGAVSQAQTF